MIGPDAPNVAGLVYIAAFGIDQGESLGALLSQGPPTPALAHLFTDQLGFGWLSHDDFVDHFAADVDPIRANVMYAVQQGLAGSAFTEPPTGPSPSVVLVHRAWAGSSSWDAVVSDLQRGSCVLRGRLDRPSVISRAKRNPGPFDMRS